MLCYMALVWNEADPIKCETARRLMQQFQSRVPRWQIVFDQPGLVVACQITSHARIDEVYSLSMQRGVVLGKLFEREYEGGRAPSRVAFDERQSAHVISSEGKELIERYWGRYVAFLRDGRSDRKWVVRDPSGGLPCYMCRIQGLDLYFRRLEDAEQLSSLPLSVSRRGLLGHMVFMVPCMRVTGLSEVVPLLAGECVEHDGESQTRRFHWNPLVVASTNVIEDPEEATRLMRKTVRACVHAWASCFDSILHGLSGGVDSSIVLACLADAPGKPRILCENRYSRSDSKQDERAFARLVAKRIGCELIETQYTEDFRFHLPIELPKATDPFYIGQPFYAGVPLLTVNGTPPPLFTGHGGDELFFKSSRLPATADYLFCRGLSSSALRIMLDDIRIDETSVWRVARKAIPYGLLHRPWNFRKNYIEQLRRTATTHADDLLPAHVREEAYADEQLMHPLFIHDVAGVPPGKIHHCSLVALAANLMSSAMKCAPTLPPQAQKQPVEINPLISQPLMELSLRTPLYLLRYGGMDRAIARNAFRSDLPRSILQRRIKGGGNGEIRAALARNIGAIRELLREGLLVQEGFLDPEKLRVALSVNAPSRLKIPPTRLLHYFNVEAWYRNWRKPVREAAEQTGLSLHDRCADRLRAGSSSAAWGHL